MPNCCELTGKKVLRANRVSHANNKTKCMLKPNLQRKKYWIPELRKNVTLKLSTSAIKTISKRGGLSSAILQEKVKHLSPRLQTIRKDLRRPRAKAAKSS